jgi:hypothetical protein
VNLWTAFESVFQAILRKPQEGEGEEWNIKEGNAGLERPPTNTASRNKIQRKIGAGAASPKVQHRRGASPAGSHLVQHTQGFDEGQGKRHRSASAIGYMSVPLAYEGRRIKDDEAWMIEE